jgi:HlyD family secretion protein
MKKIWARIGVFLGIVLIVSAKNIYHATTEGKIKVKTTSIEKREILDMVMVPGTLKLLNEQKIFVDPEKGEVNEILVKEGDKVKKGDPIIRYNNEELQLEKQQNQLSIESNYIRIRQLKKQINDLKEKRDKLTKELGEKEAKEQIENEENQLNTDLKVAEIDLKRNLLQKETIEKKLEELVIKSNLDGVVISVNREALKPIDTQSPVLVYIGDITNFKVEGFISEYDSLKVKEGQHVTIKSEVIPDQEWKGKVSKIGIMPNPTNQIDGGNSANTSVLYPIEVLVESNDVSAKPGFRVIMEIETDKRKVSTLPLKAIKQEEDHYFVFIIKDGKAVKKEVQIGLTQDQFVEIKEGLTEEDKVIINPPDNLKSGTEVVVK